MSDGTKFFRLISWVIIAIRLGAADGSDDCQSQKVGIPLEAPEGQVIWNDSAEHCEQYWSWVIQENVPADMGIVLEIHYMQLVEEDEVKIFDNVQTHKSYAVRRYDVQQCDTAPVLLYNNQAVILAHANKDKRRNLYSRFNITISTHPLSSMPEGVSIESGSNDIGSRYRYNCSSTPLIPDVLLCDKVPQCIGNEDEANCDYHQQSCGESWLPYENICLKFIFSYVFIHKPDVLYDSTPLVAEKSCRENYQANLVQIPRAEDRDFVGAIVSRSGFYTVTVGLRKMRTVSKRIQRMYRFMWQWGGRGGPVAYDQPKIQWDGILQDCSMLKVSPSLMVIPTPCVNGDKRPDGYVCAKSNPLTGQAIDSSTKSVLLSEVSETLDKVSTKSCWDGSSVLKFHLCPILSADIESAHQINASNIGPFSNPGYSELGLPLFDCRYGQGVHYSLICDGFNDCVDGSDELVCGDPLFDEFSSAFFACRRLQAIPASYRCNGLMDCLDDSDEEECSACTGLHEHLYELRMCPQMGCVPSVYAQRIATCPVLDIMSEPENLDLDFAQVTLDGYGMFRLKSLNESIRCPATHYQCPDGFCIPTFLLNNGEQDCPKGEDENIPLVNFRCPGFYRCYRTMNCVHPRYVCDGVPHCPNRDDELYCNLKCPSVCSCEGYAYTCHDEFDIRQHLLVRYLDLSGVLNLSLADLHLAEYLHFLNLSSCGLKSIALKGYRHLRILDLSHNALSNLTLLDLENMNQLLLLNLSDNPIVTRLDSVFNSFLSKAGFIQLETLIMVNVSLRSLREDSFDSLSELATLDIRGNNIEHFSIDTFQHLDKLHVLRTDNAKLCCAVAASNPFRCEAPADELSSCSDLLRTDFFRVFLWFLALLAITGNVGVLVYRLFLEPAGHLHGYKVLVVNLCVSDFLMGVYLTMIGTADAYYRGRYVSEDMHWRNSTTCKTAGFFALLSSEVSAFVLCLITADRVLTLYFPLRTRLHFTRFSAIASCGVVWIIGMMLATLPLLQVTSDWLFYSQTGLCLPLPITPPQLPASRYIFAVFTVLNFVLFVIIGCGQVFIFRAIRSAAADAHVKNRQEHELTIARHLFLVAFSDFCCWFPVGFMGLLAAGGVPVSGEINVWVAIFVLPLNSALNPFLYTLPAAADRWRKHRDEKRGQRMLRKLQTEIDRWPVHEVEMLVRHCLRSKLAGKDLILTEQKGNNADNNLHRKCTCFEDSTQFL